MENRLKMERRRVGEEHRSKFKQCFWKENTELYFSVLISTSLNYATRQICMAFLPHGRACHGSPRRNVPAYQSGCHLQLPCNSPSLWGLGGPKISQTNLQRSLHGLLPSVCRSYPTTTLVPGELEAASVLRARGTRRTESRRAQHRTQASEANL